MLLFIREGLRGSEILRGGGLHYAHGHVPDPYLDLFWDQRDKVDTLLQKPGESTSFIFLSTILD